MVFTFFAASFTLYFVYSLFQRGDRFGFMMAALLPVFVLAWVIKTFILDPRKTATSVYFITDQRVIIASRSTGLQIKEFDLEDLPPVKMEKDQSGSGSISFAMPGQKYKNHANPLSLYSEGFEAVGDVDRVFLILESAARSRMQANKNE